MNKFYFLSSQFTIITTTKTFTIIKNISWINKLNEFLFLIINSWKNIFWVQFHVLIFFHIFNVWKYFHFINKLFMENPKWKNQYFYYLIDRNYIFTFLIARKNLRTFFFFYLIIIIIGNRNVVYMVQFFFFCSKENKMKIIWKFYEIGKFVEQMCLAWLEKCK